MSTPLLSPPDYTQVLLLYQVASESTIVMVLAQQHDPLGSRGLLTAIEYKGNMLGKLSNMKA